jgi:hypothetical protein
MAFALPALLLAAPAARAQHWNEIGPGRDLLSSTIVDFDAFRQRTAAGAQASAAAPAMQQARAPIPILDWMPPAAAPAAAPAPVRRAAPRRARPTPVRDDPAPRTAAAPAGQDWDRAFAERERELERLRRILEEDRLRYDRSRQPQLQ